MYTPLRSHYLIGILFLFFSSSLFSQTGSISIQGILKNFDGTVAKDGKYDMEFKIYTQSTGGTAIWSETQSGADAVEVTGGVYNTILGKTPTGLTDLQNLLFDQPYFVGITVLSGSNPLEMSPRIQLAYSVKSLHADRSIHSDTADIALMARGVAFETSGIAEVNGDLRLSSSKNIVVAPGSDLFVDTVHAKRVKAESAVISGDVDATGAMYAGRFNNYWNTHQVLTPVLTGERFENKPVYSLVISGAGAVGDNWNTVYTFPSGVIPRLIEASGFWVLPSTGVTYPISTGGVDPIIGTNADPVKVYFFCSVGEWVNDYWYTIKFVYE
jgi:hypothetical protein